ncbi:MAG: Cys-tRNA(Pro)/Cys-tRNA(Cys) deacylase [Gaiellales bacterium]|nr:Cys-tRNA(Pro)/Cys-tRNA(Cys) deacylase [Gaiellales bacterium]
MAVTRGMQYLREQGVPFDEHRYEHRVKGAAYAAEALGLAAAVVAKTLVIRLDGGFAFALVPGDRELSLRGVARAAASRSAALASERDAQRLTGYQIGGISPFGSRTALPVYAVGEWLAHERVALNGGGRGVILELASADLRRLLSPVPIPE